MKSLDVLQRLAKQAVEQERHALQAIGDQIADVEGQIGIRLQAIERETAAAPDFMSSGATLAAFVQAEKARIQGLQNRLHQLRQGYDAQLERVKQERVEEKRYQRLAERRARQAAADAAAREQKTLDELVMIGRRRS